MRLLVMPDLLQLSADWQMAIDFMRRGDSLGGINKS
jgi:hypothetical protein